MPTRREALGALMLPLARGLGWCKTGAIVNPSGLRIAPSVYTTLDELDRVCSVIENVIRKGLPRPRQGRTSSSGPSIFST